jgi:serine protease AprX
MSRLARTGATVSAALLVGAVLAPAATAVPQRGGGPVGTYVLQARSGSLASVTHAVSRSGGRVLRDLPTLDSAIIRMPATAASSWQTDGRVVSVVPDSRLHLLADSYDPNTDVNSLFNIETSVGARSAWTKGTGAGIDVALIDSGISPVAGLNSPGKVVNGPDLSFDSQNSNVRYLDEYGHGTHMAGIIAGHDAGVTAGPDASTTTFLGLAPDARLVNVKVADAHGVTDVSQVIAGIDWVVQHAHDPGMNIRVLNLSFGTDSSQSYLIDPLAHAAEVAWRSGIVVVSSAGNSGAASGRLTSPAIDPFIIAVGAADTRGTNSSNDDTIPSFSSNGDGNRNPDFVAPGVHVQSLRVPGSYIDNQFGATGAINSRFFRGSGTSQAAAVASGAIALLLQAHPDARPGQIKTMIDVNANVLPMAGKQAQGNGVLSLRGIMGGNLPTYRAQPFQRGTGGGSIDAARGSSTVSLNGVALTGEQDIFGSPLDTAALAAAEDNSSAWNGGTWNGTSWAGSGWNGTSWAGTSWAGTSWAGTSWAGTSWAGTSLADGTWNGAAWAGTSWAGTSWAGTSWAGTSWAGTSWATSDWS